MNYRMIGADGKTYGPVAGEKLREWFREGRVDAATQVQEDGQTAWARMDQCAEFTDLFGKPPVAPPPAPASQSAEEIAREIMERGYSIDVGSCLSRAWAMVKADFWLIVGASFVAALVAGAIPLLLTGPMMGGLYMLYLRKMRGEPASFETAFYGFSVAFVPLMLAGVVSSLLGCLGLLMCLLPGIYLLVSWVFAVPLVVDKRLDFWPAMELSRKVVSMHWWSIFFMLVVLGLFTVLGLLLCCVGVYITAAISQVAMICAYEDIFGNRRPEQ